MKILVLGCAALAALGITFWFMGGSASWEAKTSTRSSLTPPTVATKSPLVPASSVSLPKSAALTKGSAVFDWRAAAIEKMPRDETREKAFRALALEWAARNPAAAENWAATLTDASERELALSRIAMVWADTDPGAAIGMALRDQLPSWAIDDLVEKWSLRNFPAALNWASELSPGTERDEVLARILIARAQVDPATAAGLVGNRLPPGSVQEEAAMSVLYLWLPRDQAAASAWVAKFPAGELRTRAETEVTGFLAHQLSAASPAKR